MTRAKGIICTRVALIVGAVGLIELLCRLGMIKPLTMIAPSQMALELARMIASGELLAPAAYTFVEVGTAFVISIVVGGALGALVHALPRLRVPRVMRKVARVHRLSRVKEARLITLPSAAPYLLTGFKLAFAYLFIGIIAGEFILSGGGLGYDIAYAYESFENRKMYALMLFVLLIATGVNGALHVWDGRLARRRGRT